MAPSNNWNGNVQKGYAFEAEFQLQAADATPYPVAGATWEYVVRSSPTDTGAPLIRLTATAGPHGAITLATVNRTLVTVSLTATATDLPPGVYAHALVMNPGDPGAYAWVVGAFIVTPVAQQ